MSLLSTFSSVNIWAVLVAGIVHMLVGLVWYQSNLFGATWSKLTEKDLNPAKNWLAAGLVGHILIALVLSIIIHLAGATTILQGFIVGIMTWLGFIVTIEIGELIWEKIPFKLFLLRIGEHFLALGLAGAILAVWQ